MGRRGDRTGLKSLALGAACTLGASLVAIMASGTWDAAPWDAAPEAPAAGPPPADVSMPVKSSRPGCELDGDCYVPRLLHAAPGREVVWQNDDVAFHTVTSGAYGAPDGLFDSGHMGPGDRFSFAFWEPGRHAYHCTLHPWMAGEVAVSEASVER